MDKFLAVETLVILLLLVVSVVAIVVRRIRVPYTVALVLVGLFITTFEPDILGSPGTGSKKKAFSPVELPQFVQKIGASTGVEVILVR